MNQKRYLKSKDFADTVGTTKHTLFHYDEIGLFKPEVVSDNGYRYYSIWQINQFHVIELLKDLGMPLKEIKSYLDKRTPKNFYDLLNKQEETIDKEINKLKQRKQWIKEQIQVLEETFSLDLNEIKVKEFDQYYMYSLDLPSYDDPTIARKISELIISTQNSSLSIQSSISPAFSRHIAY